MPSIEIVIVIVVLLVLFGGALIPRLARNLGRTKSEMSKLRKDKDHTNGEGNSGA